MTKTRAIRDEGLVRIILRAGGWLEVGRRTKKVYAVRDKNDDGALVDQIVFHRLEKGGLIKRKKISTGLATWMASPALLSSETPS